MTTNNVIINKMTLNDIDKVLIIEELCFNTPWSKKSFYEDIKNNNLSIYFVAKTADRIIGYASMWKVLNEGQIMNIAVHPEFRGVGVGRNLITALINISKKEEITDLILEVRRSNIIAKELYLKFGFQIEGIRKSYYSDNGEDAIIMHKRQI